VVRNKEYPVNPNSLRADISIAKSFISDII